MVVPAAIFGLAGRMLIDVILALDTVNPVEPVIEPNSAEIVVVPLVRLVTNPALLIGAIAACEELHATVAVMSCVLLSLKVPVATNCLEAPTGMLEFTGVTAIETKLAPVTVSIALPVTDPEVALTLAVPAATPVANPEESMLATLGAEDDQLTEVNN